MSVITELPEQKQAYVRNRSKGLNKRQAALKAGYALNTARIATSAIETPDVKAVFRAIVDRAAGMDAVARTLVEGLHATETRLASFEGKFTDERVVPDYATRAKYAQMISEYAGYVSPHESQSTNLHILAALPSIATAPIDVSVKSGPRDVEIPRDVEPAKGAV